MSSVLECFTCTFKVIYTRRTDLLVPFFGDLSLEHGLPTMQLDGADTVNYLEILFIGR